MFETSKKSRKDETGREEVKIFEDIFRSLRKNISFYYEKDKVDEESRQGQQEVDEIEVEVQEIEVS